MGSFLPLPLPLLDRVSLCSAAGWPRTLELTEIHLPYLLSARVKGVHCNVQLPSLCLLEILYRQRARPVAQLLSAHLARRKP